MNKNNTLVVAVTSTALFDLEVEQAKFDKTWPIDPDAAVREYREEMTRNLEKSLNAGPAMRLVKSLLNLNQYAEDPTYNPLTEVVIMSRNCPESGLRISKSLRGHDVEAVRSVFSGGESVTGYLECFGADLFLTTSPEDAQEVIDMDICAAAVISAGNEAINGKDEGVRIAFDGDAVIFNGDSEALYKNEGLDSFQENENELAETPLGEGPFANLLRKISNIQKHVPMAVKNLPIRVAVITARSFPAELRVLNTLKDWGVIVNSCFFLGGQEKSSILKKFRPQIFFDDQDIHLKDSKNHTPSAKVPVASHSELHCALKEKQ